MTLVLLTVWLMGAASFSTCSRLGWLARLVMALLWPYWLARALVALCGRAARVLAKGRGPLL